MFAHETASTEVGPRRRVHVSAPSFEPAAEQAPRREPARRSISEVRPASVPWTRALSDAYDVAAQALLRAMLWTLEIRSFDPLCADPDLWQDDDDGARRVS